MHLEAQNATDVQSGRLKTVDHASVSRLELRDAEILSE